MSSAVPRRPNLLLFMPDQLRRDALGTYGNRVVQTPSIDRFAEESIVFDNAFCQHSVCSPSRASILTGWYPHVAGHRSLFFLLQDSEPNFLRQLRDVGYHVAWVSERGDTFADGVTEQSVDEYGWRRRPDKVVGQHGTPLRPPSKRMADALYRGPLEGPTYDGDEATIETAEHWLRAGPPEPWVLLVTLFAPHPPFGVEEPWASMYPRDDMPTPLPPPSGTAPKFMEGLRTRGGWDQLDSGEWAEIVAVYYGMVSRIDSQFARVLSALDDNGSRERTMTVFFTDHGEYLGDYQLVEKWPSGVHDCLVHVPLIISAPGGQRGRFDGMVELIDIFPTFFDLAGVENAHTHFGRSLAAVLRGATDTHRDAAFSEGGFLLEERALLEPRHPPPYHTKTDLQNDIPELVGKAIAVRTADWTYVYHLYEPPELYDRRTDPGELLNLAGDPAFQDAERELRERVLRWLVETSDVFPWQTDERWPGVADRAIRFGGDGEAPSATPSPPITTPGADDPTQERA